MESDYDIKIFATGGTYTTLKNSNVNVNKLDDIVQYPEMIDGRVKTLQPEIFAGMLAKRIPSHLKQLNTHNIDTIDLINEWSGRSVSWLLVIMVFNVFFVVVLRYIFNYGAIWMQELYVWNHSIVFLLGAGYTLLHNGHVRIDLIYRTASSKYKSWQIVYPLN